LYAVTDSGQAFVLAGQPTYVSFSQAPWVPHDAGQAITVVD
jgi:hypothetical protein